MLKKEEDSMQIAIVGVNRVAANIYQKAIFGQENGVNTSIGFINVDPIEDSTDLSQFPNLLGSINEMKDIIKRHKIKKVILAIDPNDRSTLHQVIERCERENVPYEVVSDSYDVDFHPSLSDVVADKMPEEARDYFLLRVFDLVVSITLFLLFLPSWLVIALAIRLESPGGALYTQERVGKGGRIFKIYKFRSMYSDAEKHSGPQLAKQNDPRITRLGLVLRKTRLDELPQLVNVIKGDMSLIGPRPERPYFVEKYSKEIPRYKERLKVKPGLTGWAQVEAGYDESIEDVKEKLRHDLYYIEHRNSIKLHLEIIIKTFWVVFTAQGQ